MMKLNDYQEDELKAFLSFISDYLRIELDTRRIGNIRWDVSLHTKLSQQVYTNKFDKLSLTNFFILYKIIRLVQLNIINNEIGQLLLDLFYLRLDLNNKINLLCDDKDKALELEKALQVYGKITNIFERYHLSSKDLQLEKIIDTNIKLDNNLIKEEINIEVLNDVIKEAKDIKGRRK